MNQKVRVQESIHTSNPYYLDASAIPSRSAHEICNIKETHNGTRQVALDGIDCYLDSVSSYH